MPLRRTCEVTQRMSRPIYHLCKIFAYNIRGDMNISMGYIRTSRGEFRHDVLTAEWGSNDAVAFRYRSPCSALPVFVRAYLGLLSDHDHLSPILNDAWTVDLRSCAE